MPKSSLSSELSIVPFSPEHREAFFELNRAWLEASFLIEPYDLKVLKQPEKMILDQGGAIYFGLLDGEAVATFALTPQGPAVVELNKMAVREDVQSLKYVENLLRVLEETVCSAVSTFVVFDLRLPVRENYSEHVLCPLGRQPNIIADTSLSDSRHLDLYEFNAHFCKFSRYEYA